MAPHDPERRRRARTSDEEQIATMVRRAVQSEFDDRFTLRKNGYTWREYFAVKLFTPERLLLLVLAVVSCAYYLGSEFRDYRVWRHNMDSLFQREEQILNQQREIREQHGLMMRRMDETVERIRRIEEAVR